MVARMSASSPQPGSQEWLDSVVEDVVDPDAPIVDPHHHLWPAGGSMAYGLDDLLADLGSGHNVVDTVFVECGAAYDRTASDQMAPPTPTCASIPSTTCSTPTPRPETAGSGGSATPGRTRSIPTC